MPKLIKITQYQLTDDQLAELREKFNITSEDIVDIKDLVSEETYKNLINLPSDENIIWTTSVEVSQAVFEYVRKVDDTVYALLPMSLQTAMLDLWGSLYHISLNLISDWILGESKRELKFLFFDGENTIQKM